MARQSPRTCRRDGRRSRARPRPLKTQPKAFFATSGMWRSRRRMRNRAPSSWSAAPCGSACLRSWREKSSMRSKRTWKTGDLPLHFGLAGSMIDDTRHHEQQIGQTVYVPEHLRFDLIGAERHNRSLGAPADGPRKVQQRARAIAAREDETAQRRQLRLESIDPLFEPLDISVGDG